MTPAELVHYRAKGFTSTDIQYRIAEIFGLTDDEASANARMIYDALLLVTCQRIVPGKRKPLETVHHGATVDCPSPNPNGSCPGHPQPPPLNLAIDDLLADLYQYVEHREADRISDDAGLLNRIVEARRRLSIADTLEPIDPL
jgi:hypothetical protein